MKPFELTDGALLLRVPGPSDVDRVAELCQDPAIQEWTTVPSPYTRADAESFVGGMVADGWAQATQFTWAVHEAGVLVGMVGLAAHGDGSAELGYWLAPGARGRGVMSRAVALVLAAGFGRLGLDRVTWRAFVGNEPSRRVAERAGFRLDPEPRTGEHRGAPRQEVTGVLLRAEHVPSAMMAR
jgi:RimJ/RimL family protein N-acetyltransferase